MARGFTGKVSSDLYTKQACIWTTWKRKISGQRPVFFDSI